MKPWHALRRETVGLWRSVRYDFDQRAAGVEDTRGADAWYSSPVPERDGVFAPLREPRRMVAAAAVAAVIAASATGTYFAVAGGLGMLIADTAGAPAQPQAQAGFPAVPAVAGQPAASGGPVHTQPRALRRVAPAARAPLPAPVVGEVTTACPCPSPAPSRTPRPEATTVPTPRPTATATQSDDPLPSASAAPSELPPDVLPSAGR